MAWAALQTEAQFQEAVVDALRTYRWRVAHFRPGRTAEGWRTPVAYDGRGFPDLIALRGGRMLVVELKVGRKMPTAEQEAWLDSFELLAQAVAGNAIGFAGAVGVYQWSPDDWPAIERAIQ